MKEGKQFAGMGASSILMIFVVLCLTTFGMLSLVTSYSDFRLSKKAQASVENYYSADAKTDETLSNIDLVLAGARTEINGSADSGQQGAYEILIVQKLTGMKYVKPKDGRLIDILIPVEEGKNLHTIINTLDINQEMRYEVISRRIETDMVWEEEEPNYWLPE